MNLYIGVTDNDWFAYLKAIRADEVNFWQPGGKQTFKAVMLGDPLMCSLRIGLMRAVSTNLIQWL